MDGFPFLVFLSLSQAAPSAATRRATTTTMAATKSKVKKYINPEHVLESRRRLQQSYERKNAAAAGVKLIPAQQTTAQKMASMVVTGMGRKEYIPAEVFFTKPSLVFGSDIRPGSAVDVGITASGTISGVHCKFDVDGDNVTVCDLGSESGTFLDGEKLNDDECAVLSPGMAVSLDLERGITYEVVKLTTEEVEEASGPVVGSSSEASLEDRVADRKAWIAAWEKSKK